LTLSYDDFVRAHNLAPLVDIKTACRVANVGHSRFYELVKDGAFILIPNGARRNVTAQNLHQYYLALIEIARPAQSYKLTERAPDLQSNASNKVGGAV
jgi:hypothetical protein